MAKHIYTCEIQKGTPNLNEKFICECFSDWIYSIKTWDHLTCVTNCICIAKWHVNGMHESVRHL